MISWMRVFAILTKEFRQLARDRMTIGMILGIPIMQIMIFGYAINQDVRNLNSAYVDNAKTAASRQFITELQASQVVNFITAVDSAETIEDMLRQGKIKLGLIIPSDFERRLEDPKRPLAQYLVDGSDVIVVGAASALQNFPFDPRNGSQVISKNPPLAMRILYNTEKRSSIFVVPGLIGVILTMTMTMFTAVAIVREKERGNIEFLIATPVKNIELMLGKILPYIGIGLIQTTLILTVGMILFSVPLVGGLISLYLATLLFICASLTLGLFISSSTTTQFQAMQMTFFFFLPQLLMSGFIFPFEGMPKALQYLAETFPLTHFVRLSRGIILRGANLSDQWFDVISLVIFFIIMLGVSSKKFSKKLD